MRVAFHYHRAMQGEQQCIELRSFPQALDHFRGKAIIGFVCNDAGRSSGADHGGVELEVESLRAFDEAADFMLAGSPLIENSGAACQAAFDEIVKAGLSRGECIRLMKQARNRDSWPLMMGIWHVLP